MVAPSTTMTEKKDDTMSSQSLRVAFAGTVRVVRERRREVRVRMAMIMRMVVPMVMMVMIVIMRAMMILIVTMMMVMSVMIVVMMPETIVMIVIMAVCRAGADALYVVMVALLDAADLGLVPDRLLAVLA